MPLGAEQLIGQDAAGRTLYNLAGRSTTATVKLSVRLLHETAVKRNDDVKHQQYFY